MTTPNVVGYVFNPIQTTASVLLGSDSVVDYAPPSLHVALTVRPNDGSTPVRVTRLDALLG